MILVIAKLVKTNKTLLLPAQTVFSLFRWLKLLGYIVRERKLIYLLTVVPLRLEREREREKQEPSGMVRKREKKKKKKRKTRTEKRGRREREKKKRKTPTISGHRRLNFFTSLGNLKLIFFTYLFYFQY